jgi:hypothetical protein
MNRIWSARSFSLLALGVPLAVLVVNAGFAMSAEASAAAESGALACRLSMPTPLGRKEPAVALLSLRNTSKLPVAILKRNTPLEGWLADSLMVTRDGQAVPYIGAMAKRMSPTAEEYLPLKPGARHSTRMFLQRGYDVSLPGTYQVRWKGELMDVQSDQVPVNLAQLQPQTVTCNVLTFTRSP